MNLLIKKIGRLVIWSFVAASVGVALVGFANYWVTSTVESSAYNSLNEVEYSDVALVLGTSKSINGRVENLFFTYRIEAAAELFFAGKVKHILVSGDNSNTHYNEPRDMRLALIKKGVPPHCITMDFAGLRTFDSVVRSNKIFQQERLTIISQEFHNYRALFIAQNLGIDAIAYNAKYPQLASKKTILREYLARVKAVLDIYVFDTKPKFMGDKIDIRV